MVLLRLLPLRYMITVVYVPYVPYWKLHVEQISNNILTDGDFALEATL